MQSIVETSVMFFVYVVSNILSWQLVRERFWENGRDSFLSWPSIATPQVLSEPSVATIQKNVMGKLPEWTFHLLQPSSNTWMIKRDKRDSVFCSVGNVLILNLFFNHSTWSKILEYFDNLFDPNGDMCELLCTLGLLSQRWNRPYLCKYHAGGKLQSEVISSHLIVVMGVGNTTQD